MKNSLLCLFSLSALPLSLSASEAPKSPAKQPNIIYILCDDLGIGEVGCYGQTKIKTPNIDRLRAEGMLFTNHYSGSTVCAPSRCSLLTGLHTGHTYVRGNSEMDPLEGQIPIPADTLTFPKLLQKAGYKTACVGKWGLGPIGSEGDPLKQGFDYFFGFNCQRHAHSYYPSYLWENDSKYTINDGIPVLPHQKLNPGEDPWDPKTYDRFTGRDHAAEIMDQKAIQWLANNHDSPFFLYFATPLPHVSLQAPQFEIDKYKDLFNDTPYLADQWYLPCRYPRATYAAMVSCIDRYVGNLMAEVKRLGLDDNTIIMFCSDNGPTFNGGSQSAFFDSAQGRRGLKCSLYEGGVRVPYLVRWPGKVKPNSTSNTPSAMWDMFPTLCETAGIKSPAGLDGVSLLPSLLAKGEQKQHDYFYWEDNCNLQAVQVGEFKLIRFLPSENVMLFNLKSDPRETTDLSKKMPEKVQELLRKINEVRKDSIQFPLKKNPSPKPELFTK